MDEETLSVAMDDFAARRADILLCTAIIEAGLDLPNANTILVNHAHRFGLAQLYQLRGRVGRDRHRAYAYFIVPKDVALTRDATRRLAVLEELTELGSGFRVASHDLEIRGAGTFWKGPVGTDPPGRVRAVHAAALRAVAEISGSPPRRRRSRNWSCASRHSFRTTTSTRPASGWSSTGRCRRRDRGRRGRDRDGPAGPVRPASRPRPRPVRPGADARGMRAAEWRSSSAGTAPCFSPSPPTPRSTGRTWSPG